MFLGNENILESRQAGETDRIPDGTTGYHLESGKVYREGSRLKRADRRGEILVCRNQLTIELREVSVTLRCGPAGSSVFVLWCSVELVLADLAAVAAGIGRERSILQICEVTETLQEQLCFFLQSVGEDHDLTNKSSHAEVRTRILPQIKLPGFLVMDIVFRRVLTGDQYREEKALWGAFQNGLERLLHDEEIWKATERNRLQEALAALEGEKIRTLLTEQEKTLETECRVAKYVELFPALRPAQPDRPGQLCPHPHCRSDLSISQTFVCGRCQNTLHAFHRSAARPLWCDECYAVVVRRRKWIAGVVVGLILLMATPGLAWCAARWYAGQVKARAEQRIVSRDYAGAFVDYLWLARRDRDNIELYHQAEKCVRKDENLRRAYLDFCLQQVRERPESAVAHNYLGNAYLQLDPKDADGKARHEYECARKCDPTLAPPLNNLALIAYRQGDSDRAEELFKGYLGHCPEDAEAWTNLGTLYVMRVEGNPSSLADVEAAKSALGRAIEIDQGLARRFKWAGRLFAAIGHKKEALAAFRMSDRLEPGQPWVKQQIELLEWGSKPAGKVLSAGNREEDMDMVTRGLRRPE